MASTDALGGHVAVTGLPELLRDLKTMGRVLPAEIRKGHRRAAKVVEAAARARALAQGGAIAKARMAIKATATQRTAKLVLDATGRYPFIFGAEFGAKQYPQFKPWRGNQWQPDSGNVGYAVHPAIRDTREQFVDAYATEVERVLRMQLGR